MSDLSREAKSFLDDAMPGLEPSDGARARVRAKIAGRVAVGLAAGAAVVAASKSTAGATAATAAGAAGAAGTGTVATASGIAGVGLATKVIASIAVVTVVGAGTVTYTTATHTPAKRAAITAPAATGKSATASAHGPASPLARAPRDPIPDPAPIVDPAPDPTPAPDPILAPSPAPIHATAPAFTVRSTRKTAAAGTLPTPPTVASPGAPSMALAAEVALMRQANTELQAGRPERALAIAADHARRFPQGSLVEEREAVRVLALCAAGRQSEGREARSHFLDDHASSPQADRVQAACSNQVGGIQREFPR